ncbi:MAG: DUF58 domain-containing protein [Pseudomonadota bacterium]
MKPTTRLLWLTGVAVAAALALVVASLTGRAFSNLQGGQIVALALVPLGLLAMVALLDAAFSIRPGQIGLTLPKPVKALFTSETRTLPLVLVRKNGRGRLPGAITGLLPVGDGVAATETFTFHHANTGLEAHPTLTGRKRGEWQPGPLHLLWHSPWRLWEYSPRRPLDLAITVSSDIRPVTSGQIDLQLRSRQLGEKTFKERGEGSDFLQLNDFVTGMDPRSMDWKRSARAHKLLAREMQSERNHQVIFALDHGALMGQQVGESTRAVARLEHAINAMLALGWAVVQSRDLLGLFTFADRPTHSLAPRLGTTAHGHMRQTLAGLEWQPVESNLTLALSRLQASTAKRSLMVIFSDFADPLTARILLDHLKLLTRRHVVIFVSFQDPLLPATMGQAIAEFSDMAEAVAAGRLAAERRSVLRAMGQMGVHVIEAPVGQVTPRLLNTYLAILNREEV